MTTTYTKLRSGEWGIRSTQCALSPGDEILVSKKSGETKRETIARRVFAGGGVALYAIRQAQSRGGYSRGYSSDYEGWHRDSRGNRYQCDRPGCNCGGYDDI